MVNCCLQILNLSTMLEIVNIFEAESLVEEEPYPWLLRVDTRFIVYVCCSMLSRPLSNSNSIIFGYQRHFKCYQPFISNAHYHGVSSNHERTWVFSLVVIIYGTVN